MRVLIARAS